MLIRTPYGGDANSYYDKWFSQKSVEIWGENFFYFFCSGSPGRDNIADRRGQCNTETTQCSSGFYHAVRVMLVGVVLHQFQRLFQRLDYLFVLRVLVGLLETLQVLSIRSCHYPFLAISRCVFTSWARMMFRRGSSGSCCFSNHASFWSSSRSSFIIWEWRLSNDGLWSCAFDRRRWAIQRW